MRTVRVSSCPRHGAAWSIASSGARASAPRTRPDLTMTTPTSRERASNQSDRGSGDLRHAVGDLPRVVLEARAGATHEALQRRDSVGEIVRQVISSILYL
jgi:hypothetical protein